MTAEGYTSSIPRSGLKVEMLDESLFSRSIPCQKAVFAKTKADDLIDFQYGDIDIPSFPIKAWKKTMNLALDLYGMDRLSYGEKKGERELREELGAYLLHSRGISCSPDQIVLFPGSQSAIQFICRLLNLKSGSIAIENPGYDGIRKVFEHEGTTIIPITLEDDGIDMKQLETSGASCVYTTPSHQFPLGMVLPILKRTKLLQWAADTGAFIIEDDYDSEFRYLGQPIPSLKSLDKRERVIYLGTFSKAFLPAARVSYLVLPEQLLGQAESCLYNQGVSQLIQMALYLFMKDGHFARHIRKSRKVYHDKHHRLLQAIKSHFGNHAKVIGNKAGLHLLLELEEADPEKVVVQSHLRGVKVYTTSQFWSQSSPIGRNRLLLGFGGLSIPEIEKGISLLFEAYKESTS